MGPTRCTKHICISVINTAIISTMDSRGVKYSGGKIASFLTLRVGATPQSAASGVDDVGAVDVIVSDITVMSLNIEGFSVVKGDIVSEYCKSQV